MYHGETQCKIVGAQFIAPAWGDDSRSWVLFITPSESPGRMEISKQYQWLGLKLPRNLSGMRAVFSTIKRKLSIIKRNEPFLVRISQGFSQVNVLLFSQRLQRAHLKVCKVFVRPQAHKNLTHLQEPGSLASQAR